MDASQPIGIFDSGVGGLTVTKELKKMLPNENYIYFGDTKHMPYGDKSKETIVSYCQKITDFLLEKKCKAIVIACNSATSNALKEVKQMAEGKALVFDVISPVAEKVGFGFHQKIGVIATKATIRSGIYGEKIKQINKHIKVVEMATPLFAPMIEEGFLNNAISKAVIENYLSNDKLKNIDTLILGCTHYPLIEKEIEKYFKNSIVVVNSPQIVAYDVYQKLQKHNLLNNNKDPFQYFYLSDYTESFAKHAKQFFGKSIQLEQLQLK